MEGKYGKTLTRVRWESFVSALGPIIMAENMLKIGLTPQVGDANIGL